MKKNLVAALLFAIFVAGPAAYLLSDRKPPYEYLSGDIIPPDPMVGNQISVHWRVRINRYCPGWVQREITDRRGYVWFNAGGPVKNITPVSKGEVADIVNTLELPRMLGAGVSKYQAHVVYQCNWLQHWFLPIRVSTPVLTFEIR